MKAEKNIFNKIISIVACLLLLTYSSFSYAGGDDDASSATAPAFASASSPVGTSVGAAASVPLSLSAAASSSSSSGSYMNHLSEMKRIIRLLEDPSVPEKERYMLHLKMEKISSETTLLAIKSDEMLLEQFIRYLQDKNRWYIDGGDREIMLLKAKLWAERVHPQIRARLFAAVLEVNNRGESKEGRRLAVPLFNDHDAQVDEAINFLTNENVISETKLRIALLINANKYRRYDLKAKRLDIVRSLGVHRGEMEFFYELIKKEKLDANERALLLAEIVHQERVVFCGEESQVVGFKPTLIGIKNCIRNEEVAMGIRLHLATVLLESTTSGIRRYSIKSEALFREITEMEDLAETLLRNADGCPEPENLFGFLYGGNNYAGLRGYMGDRASLKIKLKGAIISSQSAQKNARTALVEKKDGVASRTSLAPVASDSTVSVVAAAVVTPASSASSTI